MNVRTTAILGPLLQRDKAWKPAGELNRTWLMKTYHDTLEAQFYDEVLFPRMFRANRLIRAMGIFPDEVFGELSFGCMNAVTGLWIIDNELADLVAERFSHTGQYRFSYFERLWASEEWCPEQPTDKEILALSRKIVPDQGQMRSMF